MLIKGNLPAGKISLITRKILKLSSADICIFRESDTKYQIVIFYIKNITSSTQFQQINIVCKYCRVFNFLHHCCVSNVTLVSKLNGLPCILC